MKFLFSWLLMLACSQGAAQSPAYNIVLQLKDTATPYSIEMKFCRPKQPTSFKNRFAHDTSKIEWAHLAAADYNCGEYFTGEILNNARFKTANQGMVWENVLVFRVTKKVNDTKPMYIVIPVFIQSFITSVTIKDVPFRPGIYELDKLKTHIDGKRLTMQNEEVSQWINSEGRRLYKVDIN